jgi:cytoskeletal protein CcmA (bactofilin family)
VYSRDGGTNMGLFRDFKDDFSQAVNELVPGGEGTGEAAAAAKVPESNPVVVDTFGRGAGSGSDIESELSKLDGLLESASATPKAEEPQPPVREERKIPPVFNRRVEKENTKMDTPVMENAANRQASDEVSVITASTMLTGDLQSSGSFEIQGTINGNITCNGKITVTGTVNGNTSSAEFFADVAKIEGEVVTTGTVKVGTGSVIIGNISASSAVIAGAVKGDIDVQGPVVVDTSAVIMGNIKSRSVQINNGAVIEGFCSQCYADIDVQGLFEGR